MADGRAEELRQLRVALGILLLISGCLWLLTRTLIHDWVGTVDTPYLLALMSRSLNDPYRLLLLAAVLMVVPHALWVRLASRTSGYLTEREKSYDRVGVLLQTLFTSFGFLGTIMGVSIAVSGLEAAMESRQPAQLIVGLGTAFDTTFLGLSGAILVMITRRAMSLSALKDHSA